MEDFSDATIANLTAAAVRGEIVCIEVIQDGVPLYVRTGNSIFNGGPTPDPTLAHNYALDSSFRRLSTDLRDVYVKDVGGGKSCTRSDVPPRIVRFARVVSHLGEIAI